MHYGVDVAATRFDDLDQAVVAYVKTITTAKILEIGCGKGILAAALVAQGGIVTAVDIKDAGNVENTPQLRFIQADAANLPSTVINRHYNVIIIQRTLHYLPYEVANQLLTQLTQERNSKLYISVSGIETAIAKYYPAIDTALSKRFAYLHTVGQDTFSITAPLCLYSKSEFLKLLRDAGWSVESIWTSAFGNHKAIATTTAW